jgi:protein-S-isoprenylcysteine O-methyltransferase Ste14
MIVLAAVLLVLVLVFSVAIVVSNPGIYELSIFRVLIPVTSAGVYFTGVGACLLTVLALWLLRTGIKRHRTQRNRLKGAEPPPEAIKPAPAPASDSSLDLRDTDDHSRDEPKS